MSELGTSLAYLVLINFDQIIEIRVGRGIEGEIGFSPKILASQYHNMFFQGAVLLIHVTVHSPSRADTENDTTDHLCMPKNESI